MNSESNQLISLLLLSRINFLTARLELRQKVGANTIFKVTNLTGAERKVLQDGVPFGGWKALGDGEIEVTTTVDRMLL